MLREVPELSLASFIGVLNKKYLYPFLISHMTIFLNFYIDTYIYLYIASYAAHLAFIINVKKPFKAHFYFS